MTWITYTEEGNITNLTQTSSTSSRKTGARIWVFDEGDGTYTVKSGDKSLWGIANRTFGGKYSVSQLLAANPGIKIINGNPIINPGMILNLPNQTLDELNAEEWLKIQFEISGLKNKNMLLQKEIDIITKTLKNRQLSIKLDNAIKDPAFYGKVYGNLLLNIIYTIIYKGTPYIDGGILPYQYNDYYYESQKWN